jgi:hypothetical protein
VCGESTLNKAKFLIYCAGTVAMIVAIIMIPEDALGLSPANQAVLKKG